MISMTTRERIERIRAAQGGKSMSRLIAHKMSLDAVPPGSDLADVVAFITNKEKLKASIGAASEWAKAAVLAVRNANEPNPFKEADDETIAAEILRQVEARKAK